MLASLLLVAFMLQLSAVVILDLEQLTDFVGYMNMATSMLETGHMQDGQGNVAFYSAGWPLFLVPFFALFGSTMEVAQYVNVLLGTASVYLVHLCAKEILPNWKWAAFSTFIWVTYAPTILYTEYIAKENLMVPLMLLQLLLVLRFSNSANKTTSSILLGLIFGYQLIVGPATILTGAIIGIIVLNFHLKNEFWKALQWRPAFIFLLVSFITLVPWLVYTDSELGEPVLNTNGSFNLYIGNNPNAGPFFINIDETPIGDGWHELKDAQGGELGISKYLKKEALNYIFENPGRTFILSVQKVVYFWMPPIHEGKEGNQSLLETLVRVVWAISYCIIMFFALIPLFFYRKLNRSHLILYGTALLYCGIHAAAYVIFRYRLPIMPIMCILASQGLYYLYIWWLDKKDTGASEAA